MLAVREIRRLGLYGLTESELRRYKQATLGEVAQIAAQCDQASNEGVLSKYCFISLTAKYLSAAWLVQCVTLSYYSVNVCVLLQPS